MAEHAVPMRAAAPGPRHYFFGYYDKCPWDATGRYLLAMETPFMNRPPDGSDVAVIGLVDAQSGGAFQPVAETRAWNWQQGCMLRWLPPANREQILFNDLQAGQLVSVILDVGTGRRRVIPHPVYSVSPNGRDAVTLNFARLHVERPGYGYAGVPDPQLADPAPEGDGVFRVDLVTGESQLVVSLAELADYHPDERMAGGARHRVNHLQFNPTGSRFIFLHRWKVEGRGYTRLYTVRPDGSDRCLLADDDMTSHFDWCGPDRVLAWARVAGRGDRYWLFTDRSEEKRVLGDGVLTQDGHCSYSQDAQWVLTDTYPDRQERKRALILYHPETGRRLDIGRFHSPPGIEGEIRCDLHPRWSRDGRQVCFDSVHEGRRRMYIADVADLVGETAGAPARWPAWR